MTTGPVDPPAPRADSTPAPRTAASTTTARPAAQAHQDDQRSSARVSAGLGALALVVPALTWILMPDLISGETAGTLLLLNLLAAGAALVGLGLGIVARREGLGVLGILLSLLGGAVSSGTMLLLALGAALAGLNAGL